MHYNEIASEEFKCFSQSSTAVVPCPRNKHIFRCDQNGPRQGAYPERYVTDPAAAGQPSAHFHRNPLGRGQLTVFPSRGRGTRSSRIDLDMLVARALKNSQLTF